jgi:acetamidase/formamidase
MQARIGKIARMINIDGRLAQNIHYKWSRDNKPIVSITPEEAVRIEIPDCFVNQLNENSTLADLHKIDPASIDGASGPLWIEGAEPGDTLEVDIQEVKSGSWGFSMTEKIYGLLKGRYPDNLTIWDLRDGYAIPRSDFLKGIHLPISTFLGVMGTAPAEGEFAMLPPQYFGGNIDNKLLTSGAKLYLPVMVPGALFSAADPHAAQGDGESGGTGIETSATVVLKFRVLKGKKIQYPRALVTLNSKTCLLTMGISDDLYKASQFAMDGMIDELGRRGLSGAESYTLCSLAADLHISELVDEPNHVVSMTMPTDVIERRS